MPGDQHKQINKYNIAYIWTQKNHLNKCGKRLLQNSVSFHDQSCEETRHRRTVSQDNKGYIYNKSIANIILNEEKLKPFPLK
jgi:hypothetical protein